MVISIEKMVKHFKKIKTNPPVKARLKTFKNYFIIHFRFFRVFRLITKTFSIIIAVIHNLSNQGMLLLQQRCAGW